MHRNFARTERSFPVSHPFAFFWKAWDNERRNQLIASAAGLVEAACGVVSRSRFVRISRFTILYLSPR
jgi:hypothetical protein